MTETTARREATKRRLVEAAIGEFARRGIDATSVEMLCEAAGFSRGAFYSNFASKDDLCLAILEHHRDVVTEGLNSTFNDLPAGAGVEWATKVALPKLFEIIAPSDDFRITLMEIQLRCSRSPELLARFAATKFEVRPGMVAFMNHIAERLNVDFRLPVERLVDVFEALFFQDWQPNESGRGDSLIGEVAVALSQPREAAGR